MPETHEILVALALTTVAGLSTGIGSLISLITKPSDTRILSAALGLSAGVMVYISFMELMPEAMHTLSCIYSPRAAGAITVATFFGGIGLIAIIDKLVPEDENPHEMHTLSAPGLTNANQLKRTGMMLTLAIGIHNFPEGIATFISALDGWNIALPIVAAIAIHNIPEGIAIAVPIYHATGQRSKAIKYSLLSGLAEPVGAIIGMALLLPFWSPAINAYSLAAISGIMVYISFDELLPGAERYGHHHIALGGVISGMAIMAMTLLMI